MSKFYGPLLFTVIALLAGAALGGVQGGVNAAISNVFIIAVLGVLEVALSFDNAVVNAKTLVTMDVRWRQRFMTWGMPIAVIGMRIVFPLAIVALAGHIGPVNALLLALERPDEYARVIEDAHLSIVGFGGTFLALVGLKYFLDTKKVVHWLKPVERGLAKAGELYIIEVIIVLLGLVSAAALLPDMERFAFLTAGIFGLVTFALVHWLDVLIAHASARVAGSVTSAGLASFVYLEVVDASFSFDGVIGAFALTNSIIIIALGLGIGAAFVRTLTLLLVEKGTLSEYRYLEHGAFWAIIGLSVMMFAGLFIPIPEWMTGLIGAVLISAAVVSSVKIRKER